MLRGEIIDFYFRKMECLQEVNRRRQAARDSKLTAERILTKRDVKHRLMVTHAGLPIAICHGDLIKISR